MSSAKNMIGDIVHALLDVGGRMSRESGGWRPVDGGLAREILRGALL